MMKFDAGKVSAHACQASTEELLDQVTVFREAMEPEALALFEAELRSRGIGRGAIEAHREAVEKTCLRSAAGTVLECSFCRRPAVVERWGWHRLWGLTPIFPRRFRYCQEHAAR
jgi:hypothetical protein